MVVLARGRLVDAEPGDSARLVGFWGLAYPMVKDGPDALRIGPHQPGDSVERC